MSRCRSPLRRISGKCPERSDSLIILSRLVKMLFPSNHDTPRRACWIDQSDSTWKFVRPLTIIASGELLEQRGAHVYHSK